MTDPYQILGVSPNATDDEVKTAYRRLSQLYHPDRQAGNSVMEEVATQKMSELNAAYDEIMNRRRNGNNYGNYGNYSNNNNNYFMEIRRMIESGNYTNADNMLENNRQENSAEWNFLKGTICLSRGWMNDAYTYYEKAVRLDPSNGEYRAAFNNINSRRTTGQMYGNPYNTGNNMNTANCLCDLCQCLMCANCLSDCCCSG